MPCSAVSSFAMSSRCTWTSSRILKNNSVRRDSDIARHAGNAALAAWTAWSISSTEAKSTSAACLPFAGL